MFENAGLVSMFVFLGVFLAVSGLSVLAYLWWHRDQQRGIERLRGLNDAADAGIDKPKPRLPMAGLPQVGQLLVPGAQDRVTDLRAQLLYAGYYAPHALHVFLAVKLMLVIGGALLFGLTPYLAGLVTWERSLIGCLLGVALGMFGPGYYLRARTMNRQTMLRRGVADMLDMLVLCLEGGVSMTAAMQRVTGELHWAHPLLAGEMNIVQRKITLGMSPGEALKQFGDRCALEEVRDLAAVLLQSERFGASVVKALRIHADTSRQERQQRAEEKAQKASVKILFPTLLCIFPAIFIVLLGPAAFQIVAMFSKMK